MREVTSFKLRTLRHEESCKNPNPGFLIFPLFCERGWGNREGDRAGQVGQGGMLAGKGEQLFSHVTHCVNRIHITLNVHKNIPHGY